MAANAADIKGMETYRSGQARNAPRDGYAFPKAG
jgi:hypothetical protein